MHQWKTTHKVEIGEGETHRQCTESYTSFQNSSFSFSKTKSGRSEQYASTLSVAVSAKVWLKIVCGHTGERLSQTGQSVKAATTGCAQNREGGKLMPLLSVAGRNPTHQNCLPRLGIPGRSPPYLGICSHNPANGSRAPRRFVQNRPAARLRPPLTGFKVVNAGFHERVSTS